MTTRERPTDLGTSDARRILANVGNEIRTARRSAGISQRQVARRAATSGSQVSRLERGLQPRASVELLCRTARSVGLELTWKAYPDGSKVRDRASLSLLGRLDAHLAAPLNSRREVPLPIAGDRRAWDARIFGERGSRASVEAESRLHDVQATARRVALKCRDDPDAGVVILLVNRTMHNRQVLEQHREALRAQFPLDGAAILRCLRAGRIPPASGILLL